VQLRAPGARFVLPALALVLHELVKGGCESCSGTSSSGISSTRRTEHAMRRA
jgi:hypothetical protein